MRSVLATALQYAQRRQPVARQAPVAQTPQQAPMAQQPNRHDKRDPVTGKYCE